MIPLDSESSSNKMDRAFAWLCSNGSTAAFAA